ncbi:DHA2 family efflux MFS transporter permease subunit [Nocardia panacis]|uniref:DHA2 family efflux MFS transporter permease subunit n=1 Tax=Nocardia panacis TaxID=2340916 RepID=A0A3A4KEL4_9NOCA|nr:DHA2 family efflux MFS transporter permease subunit [Nocardia panacis]
MSPQARRAVIVVLLGAVLAFLDATVVNVALNSLVGAFDTGLDTVQWIVTVYLLTQAAVLPATGWAARRIGAKRLYIGALLLFTIASVACGLAGNVWVLIAARVVQGVGGGLMIPAGQLILVRTAGRRGMARAMVAAGIPMVLTPIIGPTIGGLLLEYAGWQWIFLINAPIGILGLVLAVRLLPADTFEEQAGPFDVRGLTLISMGLVGVTYGLAQAGSRGIGDPVVIVPLIGGALLVAIFVWHALRVAAPILDLRLYADRVYSSAALATFTFGAVTFGAMVLLPLYFQIVRHQDAAHTGLLLAPQGVGAAIAMVLSTKLYERVGSLTCVLGGVVGIVATVPFMLITADTSYWLLAAAMVVRGLGIGLAVMPAMTAAMKTLRPDQLADATPQLNIMQRVGGSMGTAAFVMVLQRRLPTADHAQSAAFATTFAWVLAAAVLAALPTIAMVLFERSARATQ